MLSHFLPSLGNYTRRAIFPEMCKISQSSVDFDCKPFGWLLDWRKVNFDLIGLLDSYRPICFHGGGAKVTRQNGTIPGDSKCTLSSMPGGKPYRKYDFNALVIVLISHSLSSYKFTFSDPSKNERANKWTNMKRMEYENSRRETTKKSVNEEWWKKWKSFSYPERLGANAWPWSSHRPLCIGLVHWSLGEKTRGKFDFFCGSGKKENPPQWSDLSREIQRTFLLDNFDAAGHKVEAHIVQCRGDWKVLRNHKHTRTKGEKWHTYIRNLFAAEPFRAGRKSDVKEIRPFMLRFCLNRTIELYKKLPAPCRPSRPSNAYDRLRSGLEMSWWKCCKKVIHQKNDQSINQPTNISTNQSINQWRSQSINQSIDQLNETNDECIWMLQNVQEKTNLPSTATSKQNRLSILSADLLKEKSGIGYTGQEFEAKKCKEKWYQPETRFQREYFRRRLEKSHKTKRTLPLSSPHTSTFQKRTAIAKQTKAPAVLTVALPCVCENGTSVKRFVSLS